MRDLEATFIHKTGNNQMDLVNPSLLLGNIRTNQKKAQVRET